MNKKGVIIGTFVNKSHILTFMEKLMNDFNISVDRLFIYSIESNDIEYLVTFKSFNKDEVKGKLIDSRIMHVKNGCIFSINALNKLIITEYGEDITSNEVEVDWNKYKDKLILLTNGELTIKSITKIEDKCLFLR